MMSLKIDNDIQHSTIPLQHILIDNYSGNTSRIKKRLIHELGWEDKCLWCGIGPEYNGKPLTLQLNHINGDNYCNIIHNLRILCPNCNVQTHTWGFKNRKFYISDDTFMTFVESSNSFRDLTIKCGYSKYTKIREILEKRIKFLNCDIKHFKRGGWKNKNYKISLKTILNVNSNYNSSLLRRRLIKELGWEDKCLWCGIGPEYNGKPITLQLDHINGDNCNNNIHNLRILCPNCHVQTKTWGSKNIKKPTKKTTKKGSK